MVGQRLDSFTLLRVKDVICYFSLVGRPFECCAQVETGGPLKQT
jgi:hypothetical protein